MSSCFSLTVLPGPARLLLNKICIPLLRALYDVIPSKGAGQNLQSCNFYSRDKLREVEGINSCLNLFLHTTMYLQDSDTQLSKYREVNKGLYVVEKFFLLLLNCSA